MAVTITLLTIVNDIQDKRTCTKPISSKWRENVLTTKKITMATDKLPKNQEIGNRMSSTSIRSVTLWITRMTVYITAFG